MIQLEDLLLRGQPHLHKEQVMQQDFHLLVTGSFGIDPDWYSFCPDLDPNQMKREPIHNKLYGFATSNEYTSRLCECIHIK